METSNESLKIVIDPDGDIIFVLEETELRVSSKVLSVASAVFKAMFSPHFLEGNNLSSTSPRRISLPDDNAKAMTTLCNILHHRNNKIEQQPAPSALEQLGVLCDKYDCSKALVPWSRTWMSYYQKNSSRVIGIHRLVYPFYVFDDAVSFQQISIMIVNHTVGFIHAPKTTGSLPDGVFEKLQQKKWLVESRLCADLEVAVYPILNKIWAQNLADTSIHGDVLYCTDDGLRTWAHLRALKSLKLLPLATAFRNRSIVNVSEILCGYIEHEPEATHCRCLTCSIKFKELVIDAGVDAMSSFEGLCLHCIKLGTDEAGKDKTCPDHTTMATKDRGRNM
ncbi:MAG: hypothetical protein M1830_008671 [Pleopsidium flavum]|nr:MAG: hypothetical protein M1830_008671 [Pleopsidium flavum]